MAAVGTMSTFSWRADLELHISRQIREELPARIVRSDDDGVGDDVLCHDGIQADLCDDSAERVPAETRRP